jgi:hypothetical protein
MAAFPLPTGHPFAAVRPGYAGYETAPGISILNATAFYVGASGDYTNNTVTLQLFATFGGTWNVTTPNGLNLQTAPAAGQAYTYAVYTGGERSRTYTFSSITLTPAQGSAVSWTGVAPSVTLAVPTITTTISPMGSYYIGGNAIYLDPVPANFGVQTILGLTDYLFVCTTSAAYAPVDSTGLGVIPFPPGTTFAPGTTTALNFNVACRSNGIIGVASAAYTVNIVAPAVPLLTVQSIIGNTINLSFSDTTPGCTFNLRYGGSIVAANITTPYGYTVPVPGNYTFTIQAVLSNLSAFSLPYSATVQPAQPIGVVATLVGATTVSLAWTSLGTGYTYNTSGTGTITQTLASPPAIFTGLSVGSKTFNVQSVYAGLVSTTCNVQLQIDTQPPTNFTATTQGATIALNWTASPTPGTLYNITSVAAGNVTGITGTTYSYTSLAAGAYSFAIVGVSGGILTSSLTANATVVINAPTNLVVTTTGTTANLTWQESTTGTIFFNIVLSGPQSGTSTTSVTSATITGLTTPGVYTFSVQSFLYTLNFLTGFTVVGSPSPAVTATATIVAAPTSFTALATGTVIALNWSESTPNCSFVISSALGNITTTNTSYTYTSAAVGSYTFSLTPTVIGTSFQGPTVTATTARVFNGPSTVTPTLSGANVNVAWTAVAGCTYTVSSSPVITSPPPPAAPGTLTSVEFVEPPPQTYTFTVIATDVSGNISIPATSAPLLVPLPAPINIGSTMTASSVMTVTWTEQHADCTFTINGGPTGITPVISLVSSITTGGLPTYNYKGVFTGIPSTTYFTPYVVASIGGVNSVASSSVTQYTYSTFGVSLSATCSQLGTTNTAVAAYTMTSPAAIYGPGVNGGTPYTANVVYSQAALSPTVNTATSALVGTYSAVYNALYTGITNTVPTSFGQFVVPPTNIAVTANATNLLVKWTDSTTAGCSYTVSGTPGTFRSIVAAGTGTAGVTFTGATIGTAYTFVITASSVGSYTGSRYYQPNGGSVVTTENVTVPYTITSVSAPSTAVTPINVPASFTATATGLTVTMAWSAVTGATAYNLLNGGSLLINTTGTSYSFTGVAGTTYSLAVQPVTGATASNTKAAITVIPLAAPTFSYFSQVGTNLTVGCGTAPSGSSLSINTPTGLSAPTGSAGIFTFANVGGNTAYSFTVTATGTNATSSATQSFTTMGTPVITSATAQGTATITVNWTYSATAPAVDGFSIYYNDVVISNVVSATRSVVFNQTAQTNNTDTVYVVAKIGAATSIPSATVSVTDLATTPTITEVSITGNGLTVKWSYATSGRALATFQVWNSALTTTYGSAVSYVAGTSAYTSLFTVTIGTYTFKVVGTDSVGSTVTSANSSSVTYIDPPVINSIVQTGGNIVVTCATPASGVTLSIPTTPTGLTASSSTSTTFTYTGAAGNTLYSFTVQSAVTGGSTNTATSSITTLATPGAPTVTTDRTTVTVNMPSYSSLASFSVYNGATLVASVAIGGTSTTFTGVVGTSYALKVVATIGLNSSITSAAATSITPIADPTATATVNAGTITVTCGTPVSGTTLTIPTIPSGLTLSSSSVSPIFTYTGAVGGTIYSFTVVATSGSAKSSTSTSVTPLYRPGTPTVTATGTTVNVSWTYAGTSYTGITFSVVYSTSTVPATTISTGISPTDLKASFTGSASAGEYTVYVYASTTGNVSANSVSAAITVVGVPTFTQNYQKTTQTKIEGNAAATNATSYAGTGGGLTDPSISGSTLTWTGATAGTKYTNLFVNGIKGSATTTTTGLSIQTAFNPLSISGCQLWLDAADTTKYTPGTAVTSWTNKGTAAGTCSKTSGTFNSTSSTINGLTAMALSAGAIMSTPSITFTTTKRSIFIVATLGASGSQYTFTIGGADSISPQCYSSSTSGDLELNYSGSNRLVVSSPTNFFNASSIVSITSGIYIKGISQTLTTNNSNIFSTGTVNTLTIGGSTTAAYTLGELMIYDGLLSDNQRQAVEGYLAWKWGMQTSLSSTNPYSTQASPAATVPPLLPPLPPPTSVDYLVVAGGGGGGSRYGGGGGAGGFLSGISFAVTAATPYTITVGAGGAGGGASSSTSGSAGTNGGLSVFSTITATGGGGGGAGDGNNGLTGGSGGGGAGKAAGATGGSGTGGSGTSGQGFAGGTRNNFYNLNSGGGGGAGTAGNIGLGGTGNVSLITGTSITYAGGGGGGYGGPGAGSFSLSGGLGGGGNGGWTGNAPTAGTANTGGGGGGGAYNTSYNTNQPGAAGGSGVVILAYPSTCNTLTKIGSGLTYTVNVGATQIVYKFTAGTGTISW